jgi:hypothetical protein
MFYSLCFEESTEKLLSICEAVLVSLQQRDFHLVVDVRHRCHDGGVQQQSLHFVHVSVGPKMGFLDLVVVEEHSAESNPLLEVVFHEGREDLDQSSQLLFVLCDPHDSNLSCSNFLQRMILNTSSVHQQEEKLLATCTQKAVAR